MATNVPVPTLGPTGYTIPSSSAILAGVIADMQAAFGGGLNLSITNTSSLATPQGQMASSLAAAIYDCYAGFLTIASQVDPQYAQGRMQDAIGNIYYMTRLPALGTSVTASCLGLQGTVIPAGVAVAQDAAGNLYACAGGTIPASGTLPMTFVNQATGPIAYIGPMSIYLTIAGWDQVTGAAQFALGQVIESQQAFETRRYASVAVNAQSSVQAIKAALLSIPTPNNPISVYVIDNSTNVTVSTGGLILPANSVYVSAYGGAQAAIAAAIWSKKSLGCSYAPSAQFTGTSSGLVLTVGAMITGTIAPGQYILNTSGAPLGVTGVGSYISALGSGSGGTGTYALSASIGTLSAQSFWSGTLVVVSDSSYPAPSPTYNVVYTQAAPVQIQIQVTLAAASNPPSNALALLQSSNGLAMAFSGADGLPAISQIGASVYASRFYPTIAQVIPGASIVSVLVGSSSPTLTSQPININQIATLGMITLVLA